MSRKNSRAHSRCGSLEPLDILDEESEFKPFINRQEVLPESEEESDSRVNTPAPPVSRPGSRRTSTYSNSNCPSRTWSRRSSPTRGVMLRPDDEVETVHRNGMTMTIPKRLAFHIPPILVGHLDEEGQMKCDQMCREGYQPEEIIEFFKTWVSTRQKVEANLKNLIHGIHKTELEKMGMLKAMLANLDPNICKKDFLDLVKNQFGEAASNELAALMAQGMSMEEAMDAYMAAAEKKEQDEKKGRLNNIMDDPNLSPEQKLKAMMNELSADEQKKLQDLIDSGMSPEEAIKQFMKDAKRKEEEKLKSVLDDIMNDPNMNPKQKLKAMMNALSPEEQAKLKKLLESGLSPEEAMKEYMRLLNAKMSNENEGSINDVLNNPNLTAEEKLKILQGQMSDNEKSRLEELLKSGLTAEQALDMLKQERDAKTKDRLRSLIENIMNDPNLSEEDKLKAMMGQLSEDEQAKIQEMLKQGMTMDQIYRKLTGQDDRNPFDQNNNFAGAETELARQFLELISGKDMTEEEMLNALRDMLGPESRRELEKMLADGYSIKDIMNHFLKHGKTIQQEKQEMEHKMQNCSAEDALSLLRKSLPDDSQAAIDELLKQGYSMEEILRLFKKHGNDLSAIDNELANESFDFGDDPDAEKYKDRDVFTVISKEEIEANIPFMVPNKQPTSFRQFIKKVKNLVEGRGITHREILDIMEYRMGGGHLADMRKIRKQGSKLQDVLDFFLKKDMEQRMANRRQARLKAQAKIDAEIDLRRQKVKQNWGIQMSYTLSEMFGLSLIMTDVDESGPAWSCGIRPGDCIVTVNDWLITVMDRPHVAMHLFQAGANSVKIGIMKSNNHNNGNVIGAF